MNSGILNCSRKSTKAGNIMWGMDDVIMKSHVNFGLCYTIIGDNRG